MTIAFLGPRGSFSEVAAITYRPDATLLPLPNFPAVVAATERGEATAGMLAIENSIEGAIASNLDILIHETTLKICAEVVVPVRHCLIVRRGASLAGIREVTSHPQALAQCRKSLDRLVPGATPIAALSTSAAVEEVSAGDDPTRAAIGTARAAALYGGEIAAADIQDVAANVTRFVAIAAQDAAPTGDDKTSLAFTVKKNVPGSLHKVLTAFAEAGLQMSKVESRPSKAWLGDYVFLVDLEGHRSDPHVAAAIARAGEACYWLKVFGSYPRFPMESLRSIIEPDDAGAAERMGVGA